MAHEFAKKLYASKQWQICREGYIQSVQGLCESCLKKGRIRPGKIVHHKVLLTPENISNPEITLNWSLLEYDCQDCHNEEHHGSKEGITAEGLIFNAYGELVEKDIE